MPRKSRINAPGGLHHIIARGIARRKVFCNDADRDNFLAHLGGILAESQTACYGRALINQLIKKIRGCVLTSVSERESMLRGIFHCQGCAHLATVIRV